MNMLMLCDLRPPFLEISYIITICNDETLIRFVRCFPTIKELRLFHPVSYAGIYVLYEI